MGLSRTHGSNGAGVAQGVDASLCREPAAIHGDLSIGPLRFTAGSLAEGRAGGELEEKIHDDDLVLETKVNSTINKVSFERKLGDHLLDKKIIYEINKMQVFA